MKIIERDVLTALQDTATEVGIEMTRPMEVASFAQDLAQLPVADVTVLACFLLAAAKTASDAADTAGQSAAVAQSRETGGAS